MPDEEEGAALGLLAHQGGIPSVDVGAQWLDVQWVAVVPDRDEREPLSRRVDHGTVADDRKRGIAEAGEECAIAVGIGLSGVEVDDSFGRQHRFESGHQLLLVAIIGHGEDGGSAASERMSRRGGHLRRPVADPAPTRHLDHLRHRIDHEPGSRGDGRLDPRRIEVGNIDGVHGFGPCTCHFGKPCLLDPHLALRHREAYDIARAARRAVGDAAGECPHLRRQDLYGRDHGLEVAQGSGKVARVGHLDEEAVGHPSSRTERNTNTNPRHGCFGKRGRYAVVEEPVELRQW